MELNELHPQEQLVLDVLNIQPKNIRRTTLVKFDVRFDYEKRYVLDSTIGGKVIRVCEAGKPDTSFTMPPVGTLQKNNASAWFPLLLVHLGYEAGLVRAPHGDWSFIRDSTEANIWATFKWFTDTHCNTPERCARFAQP